MARSLRVLSVAFASLSLLALCNAAAAQERPRPGGPGMFGGGQGLSRTMLYGMLLRSPTVQKELDLLDDQLDKIKEAGDKSQAAMREMFSGMRDLNQDERREKMEEMRKKMQAQSEEMTKVIEDTLLPGQLEQLKGIAMQIAGVQALNDKEVQQELKMSDEQIAKLKTISEESGKKMRELFGAGADRQDMFQKMQEIRKDSEKQMTDLLTDDQKASLEKMKGKKIEIPAEELRGMGGRRGGPRGDGPRVD